jgi:hypothetical protein
MGNQLLTNEDVAKLKDPMAYFLKYYNWITFVKLLSTGQSND